MLKFFRNPVLLEKESIQRAMESAAGYARGVLVDVGCGQKPYREIFTPYVTTYVGLDIDTENAKSVDVCANSLQLPVKSGAVDTVLSNQTIEHVTRPEALVAEVSRVLRPGGVFILTAPQLWCLHEKPHDYYRFTRYALDLLCREHGLEVLTLQERGGAFTAIGQMLSLMIYLPNAPHRWRLHASRPVFGLAQMAFRVLDRIFYNPDLTLGYLLVARKAAR